MNTFDMKLPTSLEEAIRLLPTEENDDSVKLLAGGQDLVTELKEHLVEPDTLVNLKTVPGLSGISVGGDGTLRLGALTTLADLAEHAEVRATWTAIAEAANAVGSPQIRAMGTVDLHTTFMRPALPGSFRAQSRLIRLAGRLAFAEGSLYDLEGTELARAVATFSFRTEA